MVVNADASQVYADLAVLSARPTDEEMDGVPHRLFGHVDGSEAHNAARWADEARAVIAEAHAADRTPILAGGTGLYLRTLLYGIAPVPEIAPDIRAAVRALPVAEAHAALAQADPAASRAAAAASALASAAWASATGSARTAARMSGSISGTGAMP